jgi:nucleoside-diphosphate-sugar epimerase
VGDINGSTDWQKALIGIDVVIHLAARVHAVHETTADFLDAFRQVNVFGTQHLARMAAKAGVQRFIFISSVKVNGEGSSVPYSEKDIPRPEDAYGISKREAEEALTGIAAQTGLQTVILRLPLVYGPGVKANFRDLIRIVSAGLPLPFQSIRNQRSLVYLGNVVDAIATCVVHPLAANETFLVSDGEDISTPKLLEMIAIAMNKKVVLFSLPHGLLKVLCGLVGKGQELEKLTGTLVVDSSKIRRLLGWKPPFSMREGIAETIMGYRT